MCVFSHAGKLKPLRGRRGKEVIHVFIRGTHIHTITQTPNASTMLAKNVLRKIVIKVKLAVSLQEKRED